MRSKVVVLAFCLVASVLASAQVRYRPSETGPWRPWSFTAIASARQARAATAAEVKAWEGQLLELAAIVRRAPAVATPVGFAGELWGNLEGYSPAPAQPPGKAVPFAGAVAFGAFPLIEFTRNGKVMNEDLKGGETALLMFAVNRIDANMYRSSKPFEWASQDVEGFLEPKGRDPVNGLPRVDEVLIVKNNPKPLWAPVSLDAALQPVIAVRREIFENRRDVYGNELAQLPKMKFPNPEVEKMQRERLAPGGPEDRGVKEAERELADATAILDKLSPEQRQAPSCYNDGGRSLPERFRLAAGAPAQCRALVKPNWNYFDASLPRTAPQVLMVTSYERCLTAQSLKETNRGGCVINRELMASLDWEAVRAWLH